MKLLKTRYDLLLWFFVPFWIITTVLYGVDFDQLKYFSKLNWLLIVYLLLFSFSSKSVITLGNQTGDQKTASLLPKKMSWQWRIEIFLSQLLINLLTWSYLKIFSSNPNVKTALSSLSLTDLSINSGLFPLGFMLFFALTIGFFTYNQNQRGLVSSTYKPFFNNSHLDSIGISVDSYMRFIPFFILVIIFSMLILSLILLLQPIFHFNIVIGMEFKVIIISCVLLLLTSHRLLIKYLHQLTYWKWPTSLILSCFALAMAILYPLLSLFSAMVTHFNPPLNNAHLFLQPRHVLDHISLTISFWWIAFSVMNGAYIAFASRGRKLSQIIRWSSISFIGSLMLISLLDFITKPYQLAVLPQLILMTCSLLLIAIILHSKNFTYFQRATLPSAEPIKMRSSFRFLKVFPFFCTVFLCSYFGMSITAWSYLSVLYLLPCFMIIIISYLAWVKTMMATS